MLARYPNIPDIPDPLREAFQEGRAVLFLGAGVSMSIDAPGWEQLVDPLLSSSGLKNDRLAHLSPEQKVSLFIQRAGRVALQRKLREQLDRKRDLTVHKKLVGLPVSLILTTNYDSYLHQAADAIKREHVVVERDYELPTKFAPHCLTIVHLYGSTELPRASEEDLIGFEREHPALSLILQHALLTKTVLFLGFSFRDFNVLNHILRIPTLLNPHAGNEDYGGKHYAYILEPDPPEMVALWQSRNLEVMATHDFPYSRKREKMSRVFRGFVDKLFEVQSVEEIERERRIFEEEKDYFHSRNGSDEDFCMRRESTFSVLALPRSQKQSGLSEQGQAIGLARKKLYLGWIAKGGKLKIILNIEPNWLLATKRYTVDSMVFRLRTLKRVVVSYIDNPLLVVGIRHHTAPGESFASLGEKVLFSSRSEETTIRPTAESAYKRSEEIRDPVAVRLFTVFFDREVYSLTREAEEHLHPSVSADEAIRLLKEFSLRRIDEVIKRLEERK